MPSLVWRPGNWLFAIHPDFTLRPRLCVYSGPARGWALWWLWFEASCVDVFAEGDAP